MSTDRSRIVAVIDNPIPVTDLSKITRALEAIYGKGLTIGQGRWTRFEIRTPGDLCWCQECEERDAATVNGLTGDPLRSPSRFMIVCPDCGNKRCPKATHHGNECTGSNEPGQEGSSYAEDPLLRHVRAMAWDQGARAAVADHGIGEATNPYHVYTHPAPDATTREVRALSQTDDRAEES